MASRPNARLPKSELNRRRQNRYQARPKATTRKKIANQERCLELTAQGMPRVEIEALLGLGDSTIDSWNHADPLFKARYQHARDKAKGVFQSEWLPFDANFRQRFFDHSTPAHMQKVMNVINEQVEIAEREGTRDRRVLLLLPPESAKTTLVQEYLAYRVAMDETFRASIICSTLGQARKRIGSIARMLTDRHEYSDLVDTYGPFRSEVRQDQKPWTADHITHLRAPAAQVDYTLQGMGWTGSIYGDRQNLIVYDDIATLKNQTPSLIEAQWEKTWGENRSRLLKGGLFLVVGTHMREGDIYTVMEDRNFFSDVVVLPAIEREPGTLSEEDPGKALWEEHTSMKELLRLREDDLRLFELMYQQNPLPNVGAMFPLDSIESCYDDTRKIGDIPDGAIVVAGVDPSVSNYSAAVAIALKKTSSGEWMRYLVDIWNVKNLTGDGGDNHLGVVDFIVEFCKEYKVSTLCVEDGAWMSLINNSFTLRTKLHDLGVNHHPIKATEQTVGPEAIRQLSGLFNHRLINLPGTQGSKQHLNEMVNQFLTFTGNKTHWRAKFDIVKAFRQAEHAVRYVVDGYGSAKKRDLPGVPNFQRRMAGVA